MLHFTAAVAVALTLFALDYRETRPDRRYRAEQFAVAIWTSVRGMIHAARLVVGR